MRPLDYTEPSEVVLTYSYLTLNRALLLGRKMTARELHTNGFINELFPKQPSAAFLKQVLAHLDHKLDGLELDAMLESKRLIRANLADPEDT